MLAILHRRRGLRSGHVAVLIVADGICARWRMVAGYNLRSYLLFFLALILIVIMIDSRIQLVQTFLLSSSSYLFLTGVCFLFELDFFLHVFYHFHFPFKFWLYLIYFALNCFHGSVSIEIGLYRGNRRVAATAAKSVGRPLLFDVLGASRFLLLLD